jgi:hypothetical protein
LAEGGVPTPLTDQDFGRGGYNLIGWLVWLGGWVKNPERIVLQRLSTNQCTRNNDTVRSEMQMGFIDSNINIDIINNNLNMINIIINMNIYVNINININTDINVNIIAP